MHTYFINYNSGMLRLLLLFPKYVYFLTIIHLITFTFKIKLSKLMVNIISEYEDYNQIKYYLIGTFILFSLLNQLHTKLLYLIKKNINNIGSDFYTKTLEKYVYLKKECSTQYKFTEQENKDYENTLSEMNIFLEEIFRTYILTVPKAIIYTIYYTYIIFSHSVTSGLILLTIDICVIYFYKYRNELKETVYKKLYKSNLEIKIIQEEILQSTKNLNSMNLVLNDRNDKKNIEIQYISDELKYSDFINNLVELMILLSSINYLIDSTIKPFELIYLSMKSINFINHTVTLFEQYNIKTKYKTQMDNVDNIHKYFEQAIDPKIN